MTVDETKQGGLGIADLLYACCVHQKPSLVTSHSPHVMNQSQSFRTVSAPDLFSHLARGFCKYYGSKMSATTNLHPYSQPIQSHRKPRLSGFWSQALRALLKVVPLRPNIYAFWRRVGIGIHAVANASKWGGDLPTCPLKSVM